MLQNYKIKAKRRIPSTVIAALACILCLFLSTNSAQAQDDVKISLQKQGISVIDALKEVERQSGLSIGYNDSALEGAAPVDLSLKDAPLREALTRILAGTECSFEIKDRYIKIVPKPVTPEPKPLTITGRVTDANDEALVGAGVAVEGKKTGTVTDIDGRYSIEAFATDRLVFSYLGFQSVTIGVAGKTTHNVQMSEDVDVLDEVVVTALGLRREQKALSYNVQQVKSEQLLAVKDANFINSLDGKVAGVTINSSSAGIGGASKVVMRGTKSIEQSSNALYVIDGIPMYNFGGGGDTEFGSRGKTESIADLNPDDIESVSVLTGAAAAALYGSNAANGAIVITTRRGDVGKLKVALSTNTEFVRPFVLPQFQNRYGTGSRGKADGSTILSWGPLLNEASRKGYEPKDFFETGMVYTNSLTLSTGTERNQTFFSAASVKSDGMVPNNSYSRLNFTVRNTTSFLSGKMKLDVGASYIIQDDRNMTNQGVYSNPIAPVYLFPRGDDFGLVKVFERWDPARKIKTMYWPQGEGDLRMQNPYWISYRNLRTNKRQRYMLSAALNYDVTPWLNLSGRVRVDNSGSKYEQKLYASSNPTITEGSTQGYYAVADPQEKQTYADILANFNKKWRTFSLVATLGASISDNRYDELSYRGPIRENGIPNVFNVYDIDSTKKKARQEGWAEQTQSIFASVEAGWKNMLYLTLTGRNDWASQLANSSTKSFFYPSVGLSAIVSEMLPMPKAIDYLKLRASFSSVGTPYPRHLTSPTYEYDETTQTWKPKTHYPIGDLKPERTNSWELGLDFGLFKDLTFAFS